MREMHRILPRISWFCSTSKVEVLIYEKKVRQDVAGYEFKLQISGCMCANFEFRFLILIVIANFKFLFWITTLNFEPSF